MRVLLVADIHSNLAAFESVLGDAERRGGLDVIWAMGDLVGYGPEPGACLALLRRYAHVAVAGNHDRAATGDLGTDDFNAFAAAAAEWTAAALTEDEKTYLRALPETAVEGDFTLVHGSLVDPVWEYMLSADAAERHLALQTTPYGLVGHSHLQITFGEGERRKVRGGLLANGDRLTLDARRVVANPGSLGQPRDGDPRACYALLDTAERAITFFRVGYDVARTQKRMKAAGLPAYLIERLSRGR